MPRLSEEKLYAGHGLIRCYSGVYFNVLNPDPNDIFIEDIAHSLSQMPRFAGHLPVPYSVAMHCINCASIVADQYKLEALMHDASEAYLMDIPRPIKSALKNYEVIEGELMRIISRKFLFQWPTTITVNAADEQMLKMEWNNVMLQRNDCYVPNMHLTMSPSAVKNEFLRIFHSLSGIY